MSSPVSPLRLSIVDFLGVLLPGALWALFSLNLVLLIARTELTTPMQLLGSLAGIERSSITSGAGTAGFDKGPAFYVTFIIASLLLGYWIKAVSAKPAETVALVFERGLGLGRERSSKITETANRFPYPSLHEDKTYFKSICAAVTAISGHQASELPGHQPFSACKRLVKMRNAPLWEEAQHREAQVRFLVSVELALVFSCLLSLGAIGKVLLSAEPAWPAVRWFFASIVLLALNSPILLKRRRREVEDIYLSMVLSRSETLADEKNDSCNGKAEVGVSDADEK